MRLFAFLIALLVIAPLVVKFFRHSVKIDEGEFSGYPLPPIVHLLLMTVAVIGAFLISLFF